MLSLTIKGTELVDENTGTFIPIQGQTIQLEHSLVSISKWESKWEKPFLSMDARTREETLDYIRCMTITQNVNPMLYLAVTDQQIMEVDKYINDPMTATTFAKQEGKGGIPKVTTSEEIYYYMTAFQIPEGYQRWHFNRLMTLIRICNEKNKPPKKMRKGEIARRNRGLNKARKARLNSRG